mgnify:FL=1|jgi:hypothetical protein|tara:strand:+ start:829 stop:1074 length:246 start_codon:yes stop_codon:yes gene_type:complete
MKDTLDTIKTYAGGITSVLLSFIGLLVIAQVVFGETAPINVIGNLQGIVNGFVGSGASLAGVITLLLVVALLGQLNGKSDK